MHISCSGGGTGTRAIGGRRYSVSKLPASSTVLWGEPGVPLPPQLQLMCIGLAGLAAWRGRKEQA